MRVRKKNRRPSPLVKKLDAGSNDRSFTFIYLTNECQLNCLHCSFQSTPRQHHARLDEKLLLSALDELKGIRDITLTGGEPTLHPSFEILLSKAAENAGIVYVMTNGISLVGKNRLRYLEKEKDHKGLIKKLKESLKTFPENTHLFSL